MSVGDFVVVGALPPGALVPWLPGARPLCGHSRVANPVEPSSGTRGVFFGISRSSPRCVDCVHALCAVLRSAPVCGGCVGGWVGAACVCLRCGRGAGLVHRGQPRQDRGRCCGAGPRRGGGAGRGGPRRCRRLWHSRAQGTGAAWGVLRVVCYWRARAGRVPVGSSLGAALLCPLHDSFFPLRALGPLHPAPCSPPFACGFTSCGQGTPLCFPATSLRRRCPSWRSVPLTRPRTRGITLCTTNTIVQSLPPSPLPPPLPVSPPCALVVSVDVSARRTHTRITLRPPCFVISPNGHGSHIYCGCDEAGERGGGVAMRPISCHYCASPSVPMGQERGVRDGQQSTASVCAVQSDKHCSHC